jgi:hypothetical protein
MQTTSKPYMHWTSESQVGQKLFKGMPISTVNFPFTTGRDDLILFFRTSGPNA